MYGKEIISQITLDVDGYLYTVEIDGKNSFVFKYHSTFDDGYLYSVRLFQEGKGKWVLTAYSSYDKEDHNAVLKSFEDFLLQGGLTPDSQSVGELEVRWR
ncbi:MAG: hypothetical protein CL489_10765 [Acidobacteria bacterium]|nr:hypothetical protein [Acidobacteriota bacterium]|tara:strand:- start:2103 stop:2402 length:300 start_codon:yes stop_codon:yes gene_type:complete